MKGCKRKLLSLMAAMLLILNMGACNVDFTHTSGDSTVVSSGEETSLSKNEIGSSTQRAEGENEGSEKQLEITFLNVGQADAVLISLPDGRHIQIDGANAEDGNTLVKYIKSKGIKKLDFVVATHPHADHIGGLDKIIGAFELGKIYMPRTASADTPTTKTYERLLDSIKEKGMKITRAKAGVTLIDEPGLKLFCLAPSSEKYNDLNDYSVVLKLIYGDTSFLFMGDASEKSESEILKSGESVKADVLKVGHHGSRTATSIDFLKKVMPKYAIISCGVGNSYGHPHKETLKRLNESGVNIYRTDLNGTVIVTSNGKLVSVSAKKV